MAGTSDNEGLSLWYRTLWRIRDLGLHVFGPAQLTGPSDPHERLRQERQRKVEAARAARLGKG